MKFLQVVRRREQEERRGADLAFDEIGVGPVPGVADRAVVEDLDPRRLAVDQQFDRRSGGREVAVVGDVLPEETEVLGGEGLTVRPSVAGAQREGEDAVFVVLVALQDVGLELELGVIDDQPRVAVDRHHDGVARAHHQHGELAAGTARAVAAGEAADHQWLFGKTAGDRRQSPGPHVVGEHRRFLQRRRRPGSRRPARQGTKQESADESPSLHASHPRAPPHIRQMVMVKGRLVRAGGHVVFAPAPMKARR